jgi:hypothetical protein
VAGTTFADINELYWDTDNIKNIKFDDSSVYLITNVFFPHFMSCYVKKLFIRNSSQFGKGWQDKINSGKEFDKQWYYHLVKTTVGPYFGIAKCEQVLEYPTPD